MIRNLLLKILDDHQREWLRNVILYIRTIGLTKNLDQLAQIYGTDKYSHGYTAIYPDYFRKFHSQKINLLEIGIGGYDHPQSGANSLKMWTRYFPLSIVIGLDCVDKSFFDSLRIKTYCGDQSNAALLQTIATNHPLQIIIDDGSHRSSDVIASFNILFPLLISEGLYIIEDTHTSYDPAYNGTSDPNNKTLTTIDFFSELEYRLTTNLVSGSDLLVDTIDFIHFYEKLLIIKKR